MMYHIPTETRRQPKKRNGPVNGIESYAEFPHPLSQFVTEIRREMSESLLDPSCHRVAAAVDHDRCYRQRTAHTRLIRTERHLRKPDILFRMRNGG